MKRCDFKYCPDCGEQLKSESPSGAAPCSRSSETPETDEIWNGEWNHAYLFSRMRKMERERNAALADKVRLDFMDARPLKTQVHGGAEDGHDGKAWAISAHGGTLRETLDAWMSSENAGQDAAAACSPKPENG